MSDNPYQLPQVRCVQWILSVPVALALCLAAYTVFLPAAVWLERGGYLPHDSVQVIYLPLIWLSETTGTERWLLRYVNLFGGPESG